MAYNRISDAEIQAGAPLDDSLMAKLRNNQDNFNSSSGGSGGGSLVFDNSMANGALVHFSTELQKNVYKFGIDNKITTIVRVPSYYVAEIKPLLYFKFFQQTATSANLSFETIVKKVDNGQAISAGVSETFTKVQAGNNLVSAMTEVSCDLSDSLGKINSDGIAAGDSLIITLKRVTNTNTEDVYIDADSAFITFG